MEGSTLPEGVTELIFTMAMIGLLQLFIYYVLK